MIYEDQLQIVSRYEKGTIEADVVRVQQNKNLTPDHPNYALIQAATKRKVAANMVAIRAHVRQVKCVEGNANLCVQRAKWSF